MSVGSGRTTTRERYAGRSANMRYIERYTYSLEPLYICICFVLGCSVTFPALISVCGRMFDLICIYLSHDDSNGSNEIELP